MLKQRAFAEYVREAFANLYDPARLQTHPLASLLLSSETPRDTTALCLRQLLIEAIEWLRPGDAIPFERPEWLPYRVMRHRYVEGLSQDQVCQEIGLGRTSFYRYHREALEAITSMLWEKHVAGGALRDKADEAAGVDASDRAVAEAVRVARSSRAQWIDLRGVLAEVEEMFSPLADQEDIDLVVEEPSSLPPVYGNAMILRQVVLNLLSEGIKLAVEGTLRLVAIPREGEIWLRLEGLKRHQKDISYLDELPGLAIGQSLLGVYGGRLSCQALSPDKLVICAMIPTGRTKSVLIVEDDEETADLYQRYMQERAYDIEIARNAEEVRGYLAQRVPDLVLLDVLMPEDDGWSILQTLRTTPATQKIPVIVCSVLSQPRLALALGASAVLQKPVAREMLLATIDRELANPDSSGGGCPIEIGETGLP